MVSILRASHTTGQCKSIPRRRALKFADNPETHISSRGFCSKIHENIRRVSCCPLEIYDVLTRVQLFDGYGVLRIL